MPELSVTMAKLMAQQESIDEAVQLAQQNHLHYCTEEAELKADYEEAFNEALIEYRNDRQDITKARASLASKSAFKAMLIAVAGRRHWVAELNYLTAKQQSLTAEAYAYNSELKAQV